MGLCTEFWLSLLFFANASEYSVKQGDTSLWPSILKFTGMVTIITPVVFLLIPYLFPVQIQPLRQYNFFIWCDMYLEYSVLFFMIYLSWIFKNKSDSSFWPITMTLYSEGIPKGRRFKVMFYSGIWGSISMKESSSKELTFLYFYKFSRNNKGPIRDFR